MPSAGIIRSWLVKTLDRLSLNAVEAHALRKQLCRMGVTILTIEPHVSQRTDLGVLGLNADEIYALTVAYAAGVSPAQIADHMNNRALQPSRR